MYFYYFQYVFKLGCRPCWLPTYRLVVGNECANVVILVNDLMYLLQQWLMLMILIHPPKKMPQSHSSLGTRYPSWNWFRTDPSIGSTNLRTSITGTDTDSHIFRPSSTGTGTGSQKMDLVPGYAYPQSYLWEWCTH